MIWTPKNCNKTLVDAKGQKITNALEFNDETMEVSIILVNDNNQVICGQTVDYDPDKCRLSYYTAKTKIIIKGAKLVDKE